MDFHAFRIMGEGQSILRKPDCLREGMSCGLDVEPEVSFRKGQNKKEKT